MFIWYKFRQLLPWKPIVATSTVATAYWRWKYQERSIVCWLVRVKRQKTKQSCAEMLLSGVAAKQCTASNSVPILPSENHNHPPIFLPGTQLSRPYMLNRKYYLVAKKNHHIPEYWQRCFYPWTGRKRHSRSGRDWAEERTVDRSAHLQQAILRRAENSPWNDQVWEN